ncbi:MAG: DNA repair protein RadC [Candidatus Cloacimonetes bacterium]|nr:DNA repair protein RadC [Candidatus Cloacimonadota bacterium]
MDDTKKKHKERLRIRYCQDGLAGFHNYEVLELILSYSLIQKDTKQIAKELINEFGSLIGVINAPVEKLIKIEGLGERTVVLLKLFRDTMTYALRENITKQICITSCHDVYNYLKHYYKGKQNEEFKVLYLNSRNYIITEETLFRGTVNEAKIYIRTLLQNVIKNGATAIIVVHNHPGGTLKASEEDIMITEKIKKVLTFIDVKVLDHIIVGDNDYISLANERMI